MSQIAALPTEKAFPRAVAKRQAILDAAKRAFVRDGVNAAGIDAIAIEAGVSRQTVYNQIGDKDQLFVAVVEDVTARSSASLMQVLQSFPDRPDNIEQALTDFATSLLGRCMCDIDGRALAALMEREAHRSPHLFSAWKEYGPGKDWPVIAALFGKLGQDGYLDIDDSSLTARHFMALINADLPKDQGMCVRPTEAAVHKAAKAGVATFLRAFGKR
jgi:AcrR family transcriptional regulator